MIKIKCICKVSAALEDKYTIPCKIFLKIPNDVPNTSSAAWLFFKMV